MQRIDIKALPPAHRALFQLQQTAFQAQQTANDELRARVELLTEPPGTSHRRAAPGERQEVREAPA